MNLFNDYCSYDIQGKGIRGPGVACWIYIIYLVIQGVIYSALLFNLDHKIKGIFNSIFTIFSIYFMYTMCYKCQGFTGFLILVIISMIIGILTMMFIFNNNSPIQKVGKGITIDLHEKKSEKDQLKEETFGIRKGSKGVIVDVVTGDIEKEDEISGEVVIH